MLLGFGREEKSKIKTKVQVSCTWCLMRAMILLSCWTDYGLGGVFHLALTIKFPFITARKTPFGTWQFLGVSQPSPKVAGSLLSRGRGEQSFYMDWQGLKVLAELLKSDGDEPGSPSSSAEGT